MLILVSALKCCLELKADASILEKCTAPNFRAAVNVAYLIIYIGLGIA
jgi:hypothetical protein